MNISNFIILFITIFLIYIYLQVNYPKTCDISIKSNKLPFNKTFKILQISDLHNKKFYKNNKCIISKIRKLNPNIIVITGDIIDANTKNYDNAFNLIENIVRINPNTYFVSGNHEWRNINNNEFIKEIKKRKIIVLNNSNAIYSKDDLFVNICGVDDSDSNHENINLAFKNVCTDYFTVLLSHSPDIIVKYTNLPANLILSGHTHGGQIRLPLIGAIVSSGQGLFPKYQKGLYKISTCQTLYIDSGLGTRAFPIRFLNRSQVSLMHITGN